MLKGYKSNSPIPSRLDSILQKKKNISVIGRSNFWPVDTDFKSDDAHSIKRSVSIAFKEAEKRSDHPSMSTNDLIYANKDALRTNKGWSDHDFELFTWFIGYVSQRISSRDSYKRWLEPMLLGPHGPLARSGELQRQVSIIRQLVN
jgi:hypothetical protein